MLYFSCFFDKFLMYFCWMNFDGVSKSGDPPPPGGRGGVGGMPLLVNTLNINTLTIDILNINTCIIAPRDAVIEHCFTFYGQSRDDKTVFYKTVF